MNSNEDSESLSPEEPGMFRFVEEGMRLTYEFESLGQIKTSLHHRIEFFPVFSCRGYSTHKEFVASLRLIHSADQHREIGRCLVDQDEVAAWSRLLRPTHGNDCNSSKLQTRRFEFETRHGVKMLWQNAINAPCVLHVASLQPAILPTDFVSALLVIFDEFESICREYS